MIETICWIDATEQLPDEDLIVLIRTTSTTEPVWLGYLDAGHWRNADGMLTADTVTHWADMLEGPQS